ncbi:MAG: hypothetical protein AB2A00_31415 [Myxococcota bacterium]
MKISVLLEPALACELVAEAARQDRALSELVNRAVRDLLDGRAETPRPLTASEFAAAARKVRAREAIYHAIHGH